ncbi:50S ribosomal protein L18 [Minwuia thermotolerans]|uniref:Large ribosomal subunit protein uL18 n=1 Tax=Minwuia thermotolerans TaxID=2056226 RepID=A0A2M9FYG5_9PROT|nr:50S ribosomal protein L18 [Minwuia thermotolerans]PJK28498.1 50S ribosomal protein L18 [Minwuia thermotolerans]
MAYYKRKTGADRRRERVRAKLRRVAGDRLRLSIHRSSKHIYAQIIDDRGGRTVAAAGTVEKGLVGDIKSTMSVAAAEAVGKALAERAGQAGVKSVVFDRGGLKYHGRVKALADAAREGGLEF